MTKERKSAYLALLATSLIWGLAPPIIKYSLYFITPLAFLFYRFLIVSLILFIPLVFRLKKLKPDRKKILKYLGLGFLGTPLTLYFLFEGVKRTTAIDSSVIGVITPILVILGGVFLLKEKVEFNEKLGIALTLLGTIITIVQPILESGLGMTKNVWGNFLVFLHSLSWASFTLLAKKEKALDPFTLSAFSFVVGLVFMVFLIPLQPTLLADLVVAPSHFSAFLGVLYMATLGSVIAYFTYIFGVSKIEASEATVFTYLQPLFAIPVSVVFLGEQITLPFLLGALLIIGGVFICEFRGTLPFSQVKSKQ